MPRTANPVESFQQSVRLPVQLEPYLKSEAKKVGSFSNVIRQLVEDAMTFFDLPRNQAERLDAEARRLGMERRKYIQYVLSLRAESLVGEDAKQGARTKR